MNRLYLDIEEPWDIHIKYRVRLNESKTGLEVTSFAQNKNGRKLKAYVRQGYRFFKINNIAIAEHLIIAERFYGPRPKGLTVNHKDCNKLNNHPDNLEYVSIAENVRHCIENGRHVSCDPTRMPTYKDGRCADKKAYKAAWYRANKHRMIKTSQERYKANRDYFLVMGRYYYQQSKQRKVSA